MTGKISNDNPEHLARVAHRMAEFGTKDRKHPWWALAESVTAVVELAATNGPLQEPATIALQVMAAVFNERTGEK